MFSKKFVIRELFKRFKELRKGLREIIFLSFGPIEELQLLACGLHRYLFCFNNYQIWQQRIQDYYRRMGMANQDELEKNIWNLAMLTEWRSRNFVNVAVRTAESMYP